MKYIRIILVFFAAMLVAAALGLFFWTEQSVQALGKTLDNVKQSAEIAYSNWEIEKLKSDYCLENQQICDDFSEQYSEQLDNWVLQVEQQAELRVQSPRFKYILFFKDLDEQFVPELNSGGKASLAAICALFLLVALSIAYLLGAKKKKAKTPARAETKPKRPPPAKPTSRQEAFVAAAATEKPDLNALLRKATECADSEPMQAISYLEQAIEESLSAKLSAPALLLCGSLRLKNKIGEERGREQLQEIIAASPESSEAQKAQTVLDSFK